MHLPKVLDPQSSELARDDSIPLCSLLHSLADVSLHGGGDGDSLTEGVKQRRKLGHNLSAGQLLRAESVQVSEAPIKDLGPNLKSSPDLLTEVQRRHLHHDRVQLGLPDHSPDIDSETIVGDIRVGGLSAHAPGFDPES